MYNTVLCIIQYYIILIRIEAPPAHAPHVRGERHAGTALQACSPSTESWQMMAARCWAGAITEAPNPPPSLQLVSMGSCLACIVCGDGARRAGEATPARPRVKRKMGIKKLIRATQLYYV